MGNTDGGYVGALVGVDVGNRLVDHSGYALGALVVGASDGEPGDHAG